MNIELGKMNRLRVVKAVDFGMYLDGGDAGEILLPARYVPEGCSVGDELDVFLYLDSEERLVATTQTPFGSSRRFCLFAGRVGKQLRGVSRLGADERLVRAIP